MSLYMMQLLDQKEVTADFLTSKFIIAECFVMEFKSNLYVKVITLPGF